MVESEVEGDGVGSQRVWLGSGPSSHRPSQSLWGCNNRGAPPSAEVTLAQTPDPDLLHRTEVSLPGEASRALFLGGFGKSGPCH